MVSANQHCLTCSAKMFGHTFRFCAQADLLRSRMLHSHRRNRIITLERVWPATDLDTFTERSPSPHNRSRTGLACTVRRSSTDTDCCWNCTTALVWEGEGTTARKLSPCHRRWCTTWEYLRMVAAFTMLVHPIGLPAPNFKVRGRMGKFWIGTGTNITLMCVAVWSTLLACGSSSSCHVQARAHELHC